MSLIASLPDIDKSSKAVFVMHERSEKFIPIHSHKKGQLSYVEGGLAYLEVDNNKYVIPARHYFWVPSGLDHILKVGHSGTILRSIFFYTYDDFKHPYFSQVGIYPINELLMEMMKYTETWDGRIEPQDERYLFLAAIKGILPNISNKKSPIALPFTENERITPILNYISENISENHTLEGLSELFGFSERSLSRLFQMTLKTSFLQYLKLLRMVHAIELMLMTDLSISEIAYKVGYESLSSFSNTFWQLTHIRPSDFKRNLLNYR
ncbi:helix-turn-helix domain-containing protein [Flavobacterium rakeshii]|uniref:Helix-turn-helix domain-containing protein n=2 Tax=Flavobacteriaceae TaxID=49546 RepID=A0A6N8HG74_9FLAO|nr:helix-turn-helix domain-containing protein [Flavobacterium rakeshii]